VPGGDRIGLKSRCWVWCPRAACSGLASKSRLCRLPTTAYEVARQGCQGCQGCQHYDPCQGCQRETMVGWGGTTLQGVRGC